MDKKVIRKASYATFTLFFIFGFLVNSWYSRMPSVRDSMDLSALQLSRILIIGAVGSIIGLVFVGYANDKFGSRKVIPVAIGGFVLSMLSVLYFLKHQSIVMVCVSLFIAQFIMAFCEGSINIEGGRIEIAMQKSIISAYHGGFSLGTVCAALLASFVSYMGVSIYQHLTVVYSVCFILMVTAVYFALPYEYLRTVFMEGYKPEIKESQAVVEEKIEKKVKKNGASSAWKEKRTLLIGVSIMCASLVEGAANSWLSLSLVQSFGKTEAFGAFALGVFVASMTLTRISASPFVQKYGRVKVLRVCVLMGGVGILTFVFSPFITLSLVGVAGWAIGCALGFPLGMSAAADEPLKTAARVSVTSTVAYASYFIGPAVIGGLAEYIGYRYALLVLLVPITLALAIIPVLKPLPTRNIADNTKN